MILPDDENRPLNSDRMVEKLNELLARNQTVVAEYELRANQLMVDMAHSDGSQKSLEALYQQFADTKEIFLLSTSLVSRMGNLLDSLPSAEGKALNTQGISIEEMEQQLQKLEALFEECMNQVAARESTTRTSRLKSRATKIWRRLHR